MVISPDMMHQFTQATSLPNYETVRRFLEPLTGKKHDLVTMEGPV
jgi:hypothetical protein